MYLGRENMVARTPPLLEDMEIIRGFIYRSIQGKKNPAGHLQPQRFFWAIKVTQDSEDIKLKIIHR